MTLKVGDKVVMRDVNENRLNGPQEGVVVKVGRKLVTVEHAGHWSYRRVYRIDEDRWPENDNRGHGWLQTPEQYANEQRRAEVVGQLREHGIEQRVGRQVPLDVLEKILAVMTEESV